MATRTTTPTRRVYTPRDTHIDRALDHVVEFELAPAGASDADKIRKLVLWADEKLVAEHERERKLAAYRALAEDEERRESIRQASFAALENGIL